MSDSSKELYKWFIYQPRRNLFYYDPHIKNRSPILLCTVPRYDASGCVDDLSTQQSKYWTSIVIGSAEGFTLAK